MHADQDSYSHEGYGYLTGHASAGTAPDKTYNDPAKADRMAVDTYNRLVAAANRMTADPGSRVAYNKIARLVGDFNRARTSEYKSRVLTEIRQVIKDEQARQKKKQAQMGEGRHEKKAFNLEAD